jgi:predicted NUDIX family NTP pyrophosphohydrolase
MVVWALRGDLDPALFTPGNPDPDSPATAVVPSPGSVLERVEWFSLDDARRRIKPRQQVFLERLRSLLPRRHGSDRTAR